VCVGFLFVKSACASSFLRTALVTHACETWVLKETIKNKLMVFERKVLRKIFGLTKERDGT
jgi:hypothetical protein